MTLWTPDGERPIPPRPSPNSPAGDPDPGGPPPMAEGEEELTAEQREQAETMARELAQARARLLETEVSTVVVNHALGIYELAAIHLTADEPKLDEAQLAVDALAALVEGLTGRLGEGEPTLRDALHQARMAYVQQAQRASSASDAPTGNDGGEAGPATS